ncbi:MAG: hypothetical protein QM783_12675 [Phycisphaerales bacterium]
MVSFSTVPYTQALEAGQKFDRLVKRLIVGGIVLVVLAILMTIALVAWV